LASKLARRGDGVDAMRPFSYERAGDAAGAVALLDEAGAGARYLGGGTNLVDLMKLGVESPAVLVDVTRLPHDAIEELPGGGLRIGAAVRNADLAADRLVRRAYPLLAQALLSGASGQLRNMATVGGNLLQRTRCTYFTDVTKPCNKRALGSGCPAIEGHHRNHAILGHSGACVATHPSDMAVALAALDARVRAVGTDGPRTIAMPGLHRLPGDAPERDTVLHPGELITAIELPPLPFARRSAYRKVRERASFAFALVSVAAAVDVQDGVVADCRIALGAVAHVPWRALRAEEALRGRPATEASFADAADAELAEARPLRDNAFKVPLARNVLIRILSDLAEGDAR
jgi:xanthine dehydrogenase YagS FAD-binding subunit